MVSPPEFFVFVVVLECGIEILGSQVELTESHDRVPVRGDVILAPINSLHKGMRVSRICARARNSASPERRALEKRSRQRAPSAPLQNGHQTARLKRSPSAATAAEASRPQP